MYPPDPRFSENDNAAMRRLFDTIISLAVETNAAVLAIHHLSKGSQAEKGITDLGAGLERLPGLATHTLPSGPTGKRTVSFSMASCADFPELTPTVWRFSFPLYTPAGELDPLDLSGSKRKRGPSTADFLADKQLPTPKEFAKLFLVDDGRELAHIQALARQSADIKPKAAEQILKEAVALGHAFKWAGGAKKPTKYCAHCSLSLSPRPPTPPGCEQTRPGADGNGQRHNMQVETPTRLATGFALAEIRNKGRWVLPQGGGLLRAWAGRNFFPRIVNFCEG